ncbi:Odorant receptor 22c [Gryllus bimaculatus]|nr:Odorant receptor 22c [Gryllus bimaculatus]
MQNSYRNYNATGNETVPMEHDVPSFPFHNWTPYDEVSEPWYTLIYLENILVELMCILMLVVYDNFFFTFLHSASAQFKIIQASLEELRARSVAAVRARRGAALGGVEAQKKAEAQADVWEKEEKVEVDVEMRRRLKAIVRHHDMVYRFVDDVESFANPVLLNQFGSSSIICCMAAFNVALNPSLDVRILTCACVFGAAVFELGIFCAVGDHLMDQSLKVDFAAYNSEWYRSSIRIRRDISIIKMRTSRCAKITIGKFSPLNLKSYASIMHLIYSYYTMLTGVNKRGGI